MEFPLCDKYKLIRNYKIETDYVITASQVEKVLVMLDERISTLHTIVGINELIEEKEALLRGLVGQTR